MILKKGKSPQDCGTGYSSHRLTGPGDHCKAPPEGQIDDLISEINPRVAKGNRVLVTTLTKKMAEDLTAYLEGMGIRVRYMHHDIDTVERMRLSGICVWESLTFWWGSTC